MGTILTEDYLAGVVKQARDMPGKLNNILRLHFCVWTDAATAWLTRKVLEPNLHDFDPIAEFRDATVFLGLDLSSNRDLTAKATVVKSGEVKRGKFKGKPIYSAWLEIWTPGDTAASREIEDKLPYTQWIKQGYLTAPAGVSISYLDVAQSLSEDNHNYNIGLLAYDAYAFKKGLVPELKNIGLDLSSQFVEHPQGGVKKGKPNQIMIDAAEEEDEDPEGLWMPGSIRQLEDLLLEKRIRILNNPVTVAALMSAVTLPDRWGNYWLDKEKSTNKIDPAIALSMAVGAAVAMENTDLVDIDGWLEGFKE